MFLLVGLGWALIVGGISVAAIAAFGVETRPQQKQGRPPWVPQVPQPRDKAAS